jgi:hypothetical protein
MSVFCTNCGDPIKGEPPIADDPAQREPCPRCGSIARRVNLEAAAFAGSWGGSTLTLAPKTRPALPRREPPRAAELLVSSCTKNRYREALLNDLDEVFQRDLASMTVARARLRYWGGALHSIGPQLWALAKRIGIFGLIADYARRL